MRLSITCPGCGAGLHPERGEGGGHAPCPRCGASVFVPVPPPPAGDEAPAMPGRSSPPSGASEAASGPIRPCPACAENIRAEAAKCRFCGHKLGEPVVPEAKRPNLFAPAGLLFALLAWPAAMAAFFLVYGSLVPSLRVGLAVAAVGAAFGVAGVAFWFWNRSRAEGLTASLIAVVLAVFVGACFLLYGTLAERAVASLPASSPLTPFLQSTLLGGGPGAESGAIPLECQGCGHRFEADSRRVIGSQLGAVEMIFGGGGDIDQLLDRVERDGAPGAIECPQCERRQARPVLEDLVPEEDPDAKKDDWHLFPGQSPILDKHLPDRPQQPVD